METSSVALDRTGTPFGSMQIIFPGVFLPAPVSCCSSTLAIKLTYLFVFFLAGYLELEAMVAIEICGQSDALLLWGGGTVQWVGLFGRHPLAKDAGCRQG